MRKEVSISDTKTEYYCDACGEKIIGYTSYGNPTYPEELVKVCAFCKRDVCPKCRSTVYSWYICKKCQEAHKHLINEVVQNEANYRAKCQEFGRRLKELVNLTERL